MARTMDLSFLRSIKKEKEHGIIKQQQQHKPTTILFFSLKTLKKEPHNNNSVLVTDHDDDRVCLHFSVGDPSCPTCCDHQQQQLITNNKKRKRNPQKRLTLKNKKPRINNLDDHDHHHGSICLHLLLGSSSCIPTCLHQTNNNNIVAAAAASHQWQIKKVLEDSDVCLHLCRLLLKREVSQKFVIPFLFGGVEAAHTKQGVPLQVWDVDTDTLHSLVFKIWTSSKSHNFIKTWVKDFVQRRELKKGDQIGLRWDQNNSRFDFSVLRRAKSA